jgi:hypothetical protein
MSARKHKITEGGPQAMPAAAIMSRLRGDPWAAYEKLPPLIRAALQESNVDWCAIWVLSDWKRDAAKGVSQEKYLHALDNAEMTEIERFASATGYSAHLAAGATIQRYGANP